MRGDILYIHNLQMGLFFEGSDCRATSLHVEPFSRHQLNIH